MNLPNRTVEVFAGIANRLRAGATAFALGDRTLSFSQEGEDRILRRLLADHGQHGFYVDIGAHHPFRFSNTCLFYMRGWSGINVDAMPGSMRAFRRWRRRDVNLEIGVSSVAGLIPFHVFEESALNTFEPTLAEQYLKAGWTRTRVVDVQCAPLSSVLREHGHGRLIDFLSLDVEGREYDVLASNDWSLYRPRLCVVEILDLGPERVADSAVGRLLQELDYIYIARTMNTAFFCDRRTPPPGVQHLLQRS